MKLQTNSFTLMLSLKIQACKQKWYVQEDNYIATYFSRFRSKIFEIF